VIRRVLPWAASALFAGACLLPVPGDALGQAASEGPPPPPPGEIPGLLASEEGRAAALEGIRARALALEGAEATLWVQLLAVARKTEPGSGALAARAVLRAEAGDAEAAAELLEGGLEGAPEEDRAPLLALAAHLVERDAPDRAAALRERLLESAPEASDAMEARLRLARFRAGPGGDREGAVALLEELLVTSPDHPVAPEARRLLQDIRGGGSIREGGGA
jgi:tetratricopeptide (TPR) repeat protein